MSGSRMDEMTGPEHAGSRPSRGRPPMTEHRRRLLRLEISHAAVRLFRRQGVHATSGEQIGAAVGLSARTVWRYFRTKESCVEPLLSRSVDEFVEVLRSWPAGVPLTEHMQASSGTASDAEPSDEDVLAVIRMADGDPGLRAVWLLVNQRAEAAFAQVVATRTGMNADDVGVRIRAATMNAALRVTTEEHARRIGGERTASPEEQRALLATAMDTALYGTDAGPRH